MKVTCMCRVLNSLFHRLLHSILTTVCHAGITSPCVDEEDADAITCSKVILERGEGECQEARLNHSRAKASHSLLSFQCFPPLESQDIDERRQTSPAWDVITMGRLDSPAVELGPLSVCLYCLSLSNWTEKKKSRAFTVSPLCATSESGSEFWAQHAPRGTLLKGSRCVVNVKYIRINIYSFSKYLLIPPLGSALGFEVTKMNQIAVITCSGGIGALSQGTWPRVPDRGKDRKKCHRRW